MRLAPSWDFLVEVVERVIEAGATTLNIPDTVGYAVPSQYAGAIAHLKKHVRGIDKIVLSVHCHNDLGMAVANSLAAVLEGARQIECTINGLGERAGNCALEEVVMALKTRADHFGLRTGINTRKLYPTSRLVSHVTGIVVQRNKAIVGQNAFSHEAGIHQDGMLKHSSTYEIMNPEDVGILHTELVLGKHSGRPPCASASSIWLSPGRWPTPTGLRGLQNPGRPQEGDLRLRHRSARRDTDSLRPEALDPRSRHLQRGSATIPSAVVALWNQDGTIMREAALGDGPVDAVFKAIEHMTGIEPTLKDYRIRSVSVGEDAQGEASVEVEYNGKSFSARAVNTDVIEASALAFLQVINRIALREKYQMDRVLPTQVDEGKEVAVGA